jgi:spermidine synthase
MVDPGRPGADGVERVELTNGATAELIARDGGWILQIDGIRQSHVTDADATPALAVARWLLAALGNDRSTVVHLGGGLMTLPRAVAATNPAARQLVVELERALVTLVRERFGAPDNIVLEVADARAWLDAGGRDEWTRGACDAVVIDVFAGGRIPAAFTSAECFAASRALLAPGGVLLVNSVAGGDLGFTRRELATLRAEFAQVAMIVQGSSLHGLRFGNAVLIASDEPVEEDRIRAALRGDASRGALVTELDELVGDAEVVRDADELWSPVPDLPDTGPALNLLAQTSSLGSALRGVAER